MYKFELVKVDDISLMKYVKLLQEVFPKSKKFTFDFIKWQYASNPIGNIVGFNAFYGDELVGHYVTMPVFANIKGAQKLGLLSLNTATHPSHQGKGLFTILANKTYEYASENGFSFVYGVANSNSTPGFIRKLDFQLISPLTTKLGVGNIYQERNTSNLGFIKFWDEKLLDWRTQNPSLQYHICENKIYAPTDILFIKAIVAEFEFDSIPRINNFRSSKGFRPLNLYVGLNHSINWKKSMYFDVPNKFKSSPLNFIFKDLTKNNIKLAKEEVVFQVIDFDGY